MNLLRMDLELLERVAADHGIKLEYLPDATYLDARLNSPSSNAGLDLDTRTVYFNHEAQFEQVLHEIAHVVTAPPGIDYETVPEDFVLMQYERCLCLDYPRRLTMRVIDWQHDTCAQLLRPDTELGRIEGYESYPEWADGYRRARELGLVDEHNRPTRARATWTPELLRETQNVLMEVL